MIVAQAQAGPAYGEGWDAYRRGMTIEECLARSYYANRANMIAGAHHVATGYAEAAKADGKDERTCASYYTAARRHIRPGRTIP